MRVGRAIEDLNFYWYEDPLVEEDIYNYVKLHQKLDIPIMSTEYAPGRYYGMTQWITEYATDILRGDVAVTGGITPLVRLCHMAEGFNMPCEIHHGGNSAQQCRQSARHHGGAELRILRVLPLHPAPTNMAWSRTFNMSTAWCTRRPNRVSATRSIGTWRNENIPPPWNKAARSRNMEIGLRQICLVAHELDPVVAQFKDVFDLEVCFVDRRRASPSRRGSRTSVTGCRRWRSEDRTATGR